MDRLKEAHMAPGILGLILLILVVLLFARVIGFIVAGPIGLILLILIILLLAGVL